MTGPGAVSPAISKEERARRQAAVDTARASVGLEGFKLPPDEEERARRYVEGEISLSEFVDPSAEHGYERKSPD
jgi:hypothetical protein